MFHDPPEVNSGRVFLSVFLLKVKIIHRMFSIIFVQNDEI